MIATVFGAAGFIGNRLVESLTSAGVDVRASTALDKSIVGQNLGHVSYCIGLTADFRERPFETVEAHVTLLAQLLKDIRFESFTYLSSTRVYAGASDTHEDASLTVRPGIADDLYNITKIAGEAICLNLPDPRIRVVRLSNVVGPGTLRTQSFLGALCREAVTDTIRLQSHPDSEKDYIWIDDVVELLPRIALGGQHRVYNVASGRQIRHREWTDALEQFTGCKVVHAEQAGNSSFPAISVSRIADEFNFTARPVLERLPEILEIPEGTESL